MALSRRKFFKVSAGSAVASVTGTQASSDITKIITPDKSVQVISSNVINKIRQNFTKLAKRDAFNNGVIDTSKRRLNKEMQKYDRSINDILDDFPGDKDKIDFHAEKTIWESLRKISPETPLNDILQIDSDHDTHHDDEYLNPLPVFITNVDQPADKKETNLGNLIEQTGVSGKTCGEMIKHLERFFINLGHHACSNPQDFVLKKKLSAMYVGLGFGLRTRERIEELNETHYQYDVDQIIKVLETGTFDECPDLIQQLKQISVHEKQKQAKVDNRDRQKQRKKQAKDTGERDAKIKSEKTDRLENLSKRDRYDISIMPSIINGQFTIISSHHDYLEHPLPTRMDWMQWLQEIDPENADASQIEWHESGMMITLKNQKAVNALKDSMKQDSRFHYHPHLSLPNKRMGVDLHQPVKAPKLA